MFSIYVFLFVSICTICFHIYYNAYLFANGAYLYVIYACNKSCVVKPETAAVYNPVVTQTGTLHHIALRLELRHFLVNFVTSKFNNLSLLDVGFFNYLSFSTCK